ncbi:leucine-rich_repeat domain-containing protein [Hexamita inflata]|uniref:Leucine-rich repeat domain-containing protein n=1 Tax=Hexamita inflata TaxID=28002 RepID=A0AA86PWI0_9EUKA|nr:leucine-rich repeat domain-containing protein [Hexamita inflata]
MMPFIVEENFVLEELSLRGNKLTELGALTQIKTLKILDVAQNNIKSLENIEQLQQLVELDASENAIESVEQLETMRQLQIVNLSSNKISSGSSLEDLTHLIQLNVASNCLESIYFVRNMELLTHLDISFNKVQDIQVLKNLLQLVDLRLDGNFISTFTALENHPNKQLGWFTCQQNGQKEDRQINIIDNFLQNPGNEKCVIENEQEVERIDFVDIIKPKELFKSGCQNVTFEHAAKVPTKLTVTKCGLSQITDIYQMNQITWLDLSLNKIRDISELVELVDLTHLNLESNDIYRIDALAELKELEFLNLTNNKIIFSYPIQKLKVSKLLIENNLIVDQAYKNQGIPTLDDSKNYLGPNNTKQQVDELKILTDFSLNQVQMLRKYNNTVFNNTLTLKNDNDPQSFEFVKQLTINTHVYWVWNSQELKFKQIYDKTHSSKQHCQLSQLPRSG